MEEIVDGNMTLEEYLRGIKLRVVGKDGKLKVITLIQPKFTGDVTNADNRCSKCGWALAVHAAHDYTCPDPSSSAENAWIKHGFGKSECLRDLLIA